MIQINVPEHYLSLVQDPPLKTTTEECLSQLEKVLMPLPLSLAQEPWYGPTRLLAACGLALSQMQVFQWQHCQGGLHYI